MRTQRVNRWVVLISSAVVLGAQAVRAQACATCSPLSLPTSVAGVEGQGDAVQPWLLTGRVAGGWLGYPFQTALGERFEDPNAARVDLGLLTVEASARHRSGFGATVLLPAALISAADVTGQRTDPGLGDLDARAHYRATVLERLTLGASAGAVFPTGRYAPRSGALALSAAAQALTPGRGATWAVVEGEARLRAASWLSLSTALEARAALHDANDGFRWAPEVRGLIDAQVLLLDQRLGLGASLEGQWRGVSTVEDPFLQQRVESGNTGGFTLAVLPGATVRLPLGFFVHANMRLPVLQRLAGLQFNQGAGVFLGVGVALPAGLSRAAESRELGRGQWAVVDYDAEWCAQCKTLRPLLAEARTRRPSVKFEQVDVTRWSQDELERAVPGAAALPVIEIRRPDGAVVRRLEGDEALQFDSHLKELVP